MSLIDNFIQNLKKEIGKSKDSNLELELRFNKVNYDDFKKIYNNLKTNAKNVKVSKSVVSIIRKGNDTGILMELKMKNGKTEREYREKKILFDPAFDNSKILPYKLTLASEKKIDSYDMDQTDIVRVKVRVSFTLETLPNWRYDLTIMRQISGDSAKMSLKTIVNQMLKQKYTSSTIFDVLDLDSNSKLYKFEIESEYTGDLNIVDKDEICTSVNTLVEILDVEYLNKSQYNDYIIEIANAINYKKQLHRFTLKEILPQVELMNKDIYCKLYPPKDLLVTDKADGLRSILIIKNGKANIITNEIITFDIDDSKLHAICDCEYIPSLETAYIFDVMLYDNSITSKIYSERIEYIHEITNKCKNDRIKGKKIYNLDTHDFKDNIKNALKPDKDYECDGLIFIENHNNYLNTKSYKWKPLEHTTIDFLAKKCTFPTKIDVPDTHELYYLFNGINYDMFKSLALRYCENYEKIINVDRNAKYFPIQFSPSTNPCAYIYLHPKKLEDINNKVVELKLKTYDMTKLPYYPDWELVKIRHDRQVDVDSGRYFGNDYRIAELTWNIFLDPLTVENLCNGCDSSYFVENKSSMYFAQTNYLSFVKEKRIEKYRGCPWVIDACSGRGADLGRYFRNEIKNLVCIDQDRAALTELIKRKYELIKQKYHRTYKDRNNKILDSIEKKTGTAVSVVVADFGDKKTVLQKVKKFIPKDGVDVIICNFAVHYFLKSEKTMSSFVSLCKELLCSGGNVVLTFMIGERLFDALKDLNQNDCLNRYDPHSNTVLKNSIKKMYSDNILLPAGQKIGVLLPFSHGEYYEEYLVNTSALIDMFESKGFTSSNVIPVVDKFDEFKFERNNIYKQLTDDDRWYLNFFGEIIFTKK
jgi:hypothetical protein